MKTILITGGSGLVGRALTKHLLNKGYKVIILTRSAVSKKSTSQISYAEWDIKKGLIDIEALQQADFIIHLAGASVIEKKWSTAYKKEIIESRTESSKLLINTLKQHPHSVKAIISASATGWYGEDKVPGKYFTETDKPANDFLGETCKLWEQSLSAAEEINIRVCKLRTGIVLSNDGGAFAEFKKPIKLGIAAILGSGNQMISWVHIDDLCRMYLYAIENANLHGSYNAVAPEPVTNKKLTLSIAEKIRGNFFTPVHVPAIFLKLIMGGRSIEILKSASVSSSKIKETGFTFLYPSIDAALNDLIPT